TVAGGIAAQALTLIEVAAQPLKPITELEALIVDRVPGAQDFRYRRDGRSAFVARVLSECTRPPLKWLDDGTTLGELSNREIAIVSILVGAGPGDDWATYARAIRTGESVTASRVIED